MGWGFWEFLGASLQVRRERLVLDRCKGGVIYSQSKEVEDRVQLVDLGLDDCVFGNGRSALSSQLLIGGLGCVEKEGYFDNVRGGP